MRLLENHINTLKNNIKAIFSPTILRTFTFGSSNMIAQAIMMVYSFIVARWLLPDTYGIFAGCYAIASLMSFFINWGLDTWLLRQAAIIENPIPLVKGIIQLKLCFGTVWSIGLWIIATRINSDIYLPTIIALSIIDIWADSIFTTLSSTLTAVNQIKKVSVLIISSRTLRFVSALFLILLNVKTLLPFSIARLTCTAVILITSLQIVKPFTGSVQRISLKTIWRSSLPYGLSDFLTTIYGQADVTMVGIFAGAQASGFYAPAVSFTNAIIAAMSGFYIFFIPYLSRSRQNNAAHYWKSARNIFYCYLALGSVITFILITIGSKIILLLLGNHFAPTAELITILSPIIFIKSLSFGCAAILVSLDLQQQRIIPQLVSALTNISLNLWVIPHFGIYGVGYVYVISEIVLFIGYFSRVFQQYKKGSQQWKTAA